MKFIINSTPSDYDGPNVELIDNSAPELLNFHQFYDDGTEGDWSIKREDFINAPKFPWPKAIPLVTVSNEHAVDGHHWIANGTYQGVLRHLHGN